ncbi:MAG: HAD family hydrolase [Microcella pacifica]|uniref:HAD family hydrolase n=1 Tax=Microcella TaxID=337004 RepID=UPI001AEFA59F|nr:MULTISPECIES: HAD family hydrolase [Microcella]
MRPTIVLDFDGTLALGNGPISAFARAIAAHAGDATFLGRAEAALAAFEAGEAEYRDGYDAVSRVAAAEGIARERLDAAYAASRELLGSDDALVDPPQGLREFLHGLSARARLVLATNAPAGRILDVLEAWGVAEVFDDLHFAVGKPHGLVPVLREALEQGAVLAIGDIAEFDLDPATALGADTALVGVTAAHSAAATTMRGHSLADLYDEITAWVHAAPPLLTPSADSLPHHTIERNH